MSNLMAGSVNGIAPTGKRYYSIGNYTGCLAKTDCHGKSTCARFICRKTTVNTERSFTVFGLRCEKYKQMPEGAVPATTGYSETIKRILEKEK